jgi:hypothetical protein
MQSFLGLEVEQLHCCIKLHLDTYIQELIAKHQLIHPKFPKQEKVLSPGLVLETNAMMIAQRRPTPCYRNSMAQWWQRFNLLRVGSNSILRMLWHNGAVLCTGGTIALGSVDALRWIPRPLA